MSAAPKVVFIGSSHCLMYGPLVARLAVNEHASRLGVPPVRRIFTSPLLRCAETAAAAATQLGIDTICVAPTLAETGKFIV